MDQKFAKWDGWLDEIYEEVVRLVERQQIFGEIQDIIKANPEIQEPNAFYRFLANTYGDANIMGVRRQIKPHKDSISLVGLLEEIIENPSVLSRERFVDLYSTEMQDFANHIFDERFSLYSAERQDFVNLSSDQQFSIRYPNHIDPAIVQQDLDELRAHGDKVEAFADKRLAHWDKKQPVIPTFGELNACIDCLKELTIKYLLLFRAKDLTNRFVPPFITEVDMTKIFSVPWIRPEEPVNGL